LLAMELTTPERLAGKHYASDPIRKTFLETADFLTGFLLDLVHGQFPP